MQAYCGISSMYTPNFQIFHSNIVSPTKMYQKLNLKGTKMYLLMLERFTFYLCLLAVTHLWQLKKMSCFLNEWRKWHNYRKMYGVQYIFILIIYYAINFMHTALWRNWFLSNFLAIWLNSPIIHCPVEDMVWQLVLNDIWWTSKNQTSRPIDWHDKSMAA